MSNVGDLTVTISLRRRPLWQLIVRTPALWMRHYKVMRRSEPSRIVSAYAAWLMASSIFLVNGKPTEASR